MIDAAAQPVYLVDDENRLILSNFALAEWCGRSAEELQGLACRYHSAAAADSLESVAAALCPPPETVSGELRQAIVSLRVGSRAQRRRAEFTPLIAGDGAALGVLVVLAADEHQEAKATSSAPSDPHAELQEFHDRWGGRAGAGRLVGTSPAARRVQAQVALAIDSEIDVLIVGPAGSGREHVARTIHQGWAERGAAALVTLSGGSATLERLRGAIESAAGRTSAHRGALLLADVDALSDDLQFALLEALSAPRRFRVLATARTALVDRDREAFRADLAHQLSTLTLTLPSLRERREDLPLLAQAFVEERNAEGAKQLAGFTPEALEAMAAYPWPGELDELREFVRQAHEAAEGPRIAAMHWPSVVRIGAHSTRRAPRGAIVLSEHLEQVERELIAGALEQARGNKAKAARQLGMTRPRLYRRMVQLGLAEAASIEESIEFKLAPSAEDFAELDDSGGAA